MGNMYRSSRYPHGLPPSDACENYFRRGYAGTTKRLYRVDSLDTSTIPVLSPKSALQHTRSLVDLATKA